MKGRCRTLLLVVPFALVGFVVVSSTGVAWAATNWPVTLDTGSSGESHSQTVPSAPTGVTAACAAPNSAKTIKVSWTAVTHATTYTVYDATTSASGTYSVAASGVTTTSWTSGTLTAGTNYWFEVSVTVGSNWTSANSAATAESTINSVKPYCVQP